MWLCLCIDVMAEDFQKAKELLVGAVDTVLRTANQISSQAKIRAQRVHLHRHSWVQAVLVTLFCAWSHCLKVVFNQLNEEQERPVTLLGGIVGVLGKGLKGIPGSSHCTIEICSQVQRQVPKSKMAETGTPHMAA